MAGNLSATHRTDISEAEGVAFLQRDLEGRICCQPEALSLRSCSECSLNRPDKSRSFALSKKSTRGESGEQEQPPARQVALPLQMRMLLMSTWRLLFEIQWGAKITVSLLRNVRRMFIISKRVFVQWANDGNGNWRAYADKHSKKAFFFFFEQ